jgi:hypothetical protein
MREVVTTVLSLLYIVVLGVMLYKVCVEFRRGDDRVSAVLSGFVCVLIVAAIVALTVMSIHIWGVV